MCIQIFSLTEALPTLRAFVRFLSSMRFLVAHQISSLREAFPAMRTFKQPSLTLNSVTFPTHRILRVIFWTITPIYVQMISFHIFQKFWFSFSSYHYLLFIRENIFLECCFFWWDTFIVVLSGTDPVRFWFARIPSPALVGCGCFLPRRHFGRLAYCSCKMVSELIRFLISLCWLTLFQSTFFLNYSNSCLLYTSPSPRD